MIDRCVFELYSPFLCVVFSDPAQAQTVLIDDPAGCASRTAGLWEKYKAVIKGQLNLAIGNKAPTEIRPR
jgi:hypothetical protein